MTVTLDRPASSRRTPPRHALSRQAVRRRRWSASWRAALRLAHRDAVRHRGSSLLIMIMVGLPVLLISAASASYGTADITPAESLPVALGSAQAKIVGQESGVVEQTADASSYLTDESVPMPRSAGHAVGDPWTAAQLARLTGARVSPVGYPVLFAERPGTVTRLGALAVADPAGSGLVGLTEGRWPTGPTEVAVTSAAIAKGLPRTGPLSLRSEAGTQRTAQVTGVVVAEDASYEAVGLLVDPSWIETRPAGTFLVYRDQPVTWSDVEAWNTQGLVVLSRDVLEHPQGIVVSGDLDPSSDAVSQALLVLVCLGLILETTLLAGPAFAVSAARRRRSLALVGSNGAEAAQLRRYVLAQGVVLGGVAAVAGAVIGTVAGWAAWWVYRFAQGRSGHPPLDLYVSVTLLVLVAAAVAALMAAAIPARGVARLAMAGTLSGQDQRLPSDRRWPIIGAALMTIGVGLVLAALLALDVYAQLYAAGFGAAALVIGSIPCVPLVLRAVARALRHGPVPLRMASRDAARSRSRSASAIAAITVAVAVLTILDIANASDDAQNRAQYQPEVVDGHGSVMAKGNSGVSGQATIDEIHRRHPDWQTLGRGVLGEYETNEGAGPGSVVAVVPPRCTAAQAIARVDGAAAADACARLGSNSSAPLQSVPLVGIRPEFGLTAAQRAVLEGDGVLVSKADLLRGDRVRIAAGTFAKPDGDRRTVVRTVDLPAATMTRTQLGKLTGSQTVPDETGGFMLTAGAEAAELPVTVDRWEIIDPRGPISQADEDAINEHAVVQMSVERGYESETGLLIRVLLAVASALIAVAALISTALAQVEGQADLATISALGGTARFRRGLAGSQAVVVALTGALLGVALGFGPGVAFANNFSTDPAYDGVSLTPDPVIVVPWLGLGLVVIGVPFAAGLVAAVAVRRRPVMTRRLT